ncbi:response regulator [Sporomusa aerivorans]|uniref:response regulator n=1 Tax=Sporomusa aerivorans TaxID=204936 RepID=UPI00352B0817
MAKILIVDDSSIMRRSMSSMLQQAGHEIVAEADNGLAACELYATYRPDIVTMDLAMPDMDGLEAMRRIVAVHPLAKLVVISALSGKDKIVAAVNAGASHFIIKPITYDKVVKVIKTVLEGNIAPEQRLKLATRLTADEAAPAPEFPVGPALREESSYILENKHGKFISITVKQGMNTAQAEQLATDIEDCLFTGYRRFLFDFGTVTQIQAEVFAILTAAVASIQAEGGQVRAMAESAIFIRFVQSNAKAVAIGLASVLRQVGER